MKQLTIEWLKAAKDDLLVIEDILNKEYLSHILAFHSQQAIEKSLKAVLFEFEDCTPRIHTLDTLFAKTACYINLRQDQRLSDELDKLLY